MSSALRLSFVLAAVLLNGCASYKPVPDGYKGPVASISDSSISEGGTRAQIFALMDVNGNAIQNSFGASANASYGQGFALTTRVISRQVPAGPMKVKIKASHTTGAPIQAIFSQVAGSFFSVEGVVAFNPSPDGRYIVKGELKKEGSSVWIEDATTYQRVTDKVSGN
jgi:hypothetical protein